MKLALSAGVPTHSSSTDRLSGLDLVTARAALDPEFRRGLLVDPHTTISRAFGVTLPPALRLKFIEKDPAFDVVVVLPDAVDGTALEDSDLHLASGGADLWTWLSELEATVAAEFAATDDGGRQ